jgi:iron(III) transport system ATP-binding protein
MAVLDQGVVQQVGSPVELYDEPVNAFVANFVGTMNMLDAKVLSQHADHLDLDVMDVGQVTLPVASKAAVAFNQFANGQSVQLSFRPHAVKLDVNASISDQNAIRIQGTVEASEFMGESTRYRVRVGQQSLSIDQAHYAGVPKLAVGATLNLSLPPAQVRLFAV